MKPFIKIIFVNLIACLASFTSVGQSKAGLDTATLNFVNKAMSGSMKEIETGKLAEQKAQSKVVKSFGARMAEDHAGMNQKLGQLLKTKNVQLPPATSSVDTMLTNLTGTTFDKHYAMMMVEDHKKDVALFEKAANSLADKDIRAFATKQLPLLRKHLADITLIANQLSGVDTAH